MTWWIRGLIVLAVVAGAVFAVRSYNGAIEEGARLRSDLATSQRALQDQLTENAQIRLEKARVDKLLAARQAARNAADNIERAINDKLAEIYRKPEVRAWGDTPVPAELLARLRDDGAAGGPDGQDGARDPAGRAAAPARSPWLAGSHDQPAAPRLRPPAAAPGR